MELQISWYYIKTTYREDKADNRLLIKFIFENVYQDIHWINKLHPSIEDSDIDDVSSIDTSTLMLMSDMGNY